MLPKFKNAACSADNGLSEPLLKSNPESSAASDERPESSYAIVPHSINRYDWEALLAAFANACRAGWSGVLSEYILTARDHDM